MIDEVEGVRIPAYQSFETLSLARDQREDDHIGQGRVMFFGEDLVDSAAISSAERPKRIPRDSKTLKVHGFLSSDSSWVSTNASEASTSAAVSSSKAPSSSQQAESVSSAFFTEEMTPESAFTQYQRRSEDQACQVCGQPSVGFHHRAYVCEACKVSQLHKAPFTFIYLYTQFIFSILKLFLFLMIVIPVYATYYLKELT